MKMIQLLKIKILIAISILVILFQFLTLIKIIPYVITWGGRLETDVYICFTRNFDKLFFRIHLGSKG